MQTKTILVLSADPLFAESVVASVPPGRFRVVHRVSLEDAEPLLDRSVVDACVYDVEMARVQDLWVMEKVRRLAPTCPLLIYCNPGRPELEEEAFLRGASQVLTKPVRARLITAVLDRLDRVPAPETTPFKAAAIAAVGAEPTLPREATLQALQTLSALRDFSAILGDSLCADALLRQFLLLLREVIGVNRAAVFLRQPSGDLSPRQGIETGRALQSVCAIGLSQTVLEHVTLSYEAGIGGYLNRHGRILKRDGPDVQSDPTLRKEFELLGVQVAIPIFDREALVGVAVFDGRVTGEPLSNGELGLVFHLLEAMGLAVKNIWLHDQLAANHEMLADVLRQFGNGCVVVGHDLAILHANRAARSFFVKGSRRSGEFEFADLPAGLGSKVYQVLKSGTGLAPFRYQPTDSPGTVYQVSIVPVQNRASTVPQAVLLIIEDRSQDDQLKRLEIETANLRLVKQMADRLAHEIGNAMVPLSTHQQLFAKKYQDPEFRVSLDTAMADGVRRVTRLINQMRLLARDGVVHHEVFPLAPLVEEAYQEAQKYHPVKTAHLKYNIGDQPILLSGDRASLKHAVAEIMLNALQSNAENVRIAVDMKADPAGAPTTGWVHIEFKDNGSGFSPEAAERAPEAFFTTRNVGLGLGLVVSRKVAEQHQGRLEILPVRSERGGVVRLSLPTVSPGGVEPDLGLKS